MDTHHKNILQSILGGVVNHVSSFGLQPIPKILVYKLEHAPSLAKLLRVLIEMFDLMYLECENCLVVGRFEDFRCIAETNGNALVVPVQDTIKIPVEQKTFDVEEALNALSLMLLILCDNKYEEEGDAIQPETLMVLPLPIKMDEQYNCEVRHLGGGDTIPMPETSKLLHKSADLLSQSKVISSVSRVLKTKTINQLHIDEYIVEIHKKFEDIVFCISNNKGLSNESPLINKCRIYDAEKIMSIFIMYIQRVMKDKECLKHNTALLMEHLIKNLYESFVSTAQQETFVASAQGPVSKQFIPGEEIKNAAGDYVPEGQFKNINKPVLCTQTKELSKELNSNIFQNPIDIKKYEQPVSCLIQEVGYNEEEFPILDVSSLNNYSIGINGDKLKEHPMKSTVLNNKEQSPVTNSAYIEHVISNLKSKINVFIKNKCSEDGEVKNKEHTNQMMLSVTTEANGKTEKDKNKCLKGVEDVNNKEQTIQIMSSMILESNGKTETDENKYLKDSKEVNNKEQATQMMSPEANRKTEKDKMFVQPSSENSNKRDDVNVDLQKVGKFYYSREVMAKLRKVVNQTWNLKTLDISEIPSKDVHVACERLYHSTPQKKVNQNDRKQLYEEKKSAHIASTVENKPSGSGTIATPNTSKNDVQAASSASADEATADAKLAHSYSLQVTTKLNKLLHKLSDNKKLPEGTLHKDSENLLPNTKKTINECPQPKFNQELTINEISDILPYSEKRDLIKYESDSITDKKNLISDSFNRKLMELNNRALFAKSDKTSKERKVTKIKPTIDEIGNNENLETRATKPCDPVTIVEQTSKETKDSKDHPQDDSKNNNVECLQISDTSKTTPTDKLTGTDGALVIEDKFKEFMSDVIAALRESVNEVEKMEKTAAINENI